MNAMLVKTGALAALLLLALCMPVVHATDEMEDAAGCSALNRDINFSDSAVGPYTDDDLQNDFDGYTYFKRREMASIAEINGEKYLDVLLHEGCVGTVNEAGCGLQGALPLFGVGDSATLEYTVQFGDGYDFRRGGKLMGMCSGECKTGCHQTADKGFSARIMWGPDGSLYLYTYTHSDSTSTCGLDTKPEVPVNMVPNQDYRIRLTVRMNTPGQENGMASLYVDGMHIVTVEGLIMRSSAEQVIDSMVFHTFFGGSGDTWAAIKDEHIFFKSIKIWDGDCGGDDGALELEAGAPWMAESGGAMPEGARALQLDTSIYGTWNGRFCLWYEVTNDGAEDCERFILETNVDPTVGTMASHANLQVLESDDASGFYMFSRDQDKHAYLQPGKARNGNVCYETPRNILLSSSAVSSAFSFSAYCEA